MAQDPDDVERFYADLDQVRKTRGLTWYGVWRAVPSTAVPKLSTYINEQVALSVRVCEILASWAGLDFAKYRSSEVSRDRSK